MYFMHFSFMSQFRTELRSILTGYPEFIFENKPHELAGDIPVFVFHSIDPQTFEAQLVYLKENGYRTLSVDEFVDCIEGRGQCGSRSVLLTVDDGRSSFWRFGYPLLEKHGMKAVLFIIPGITPKAATLRPSLTDVWNGDASLEELQKVDPQDEMVCNWAEIRQMYASGLVSVESHTLFHREVFVSPRLVGFIHSRTSFVPFRTPITAYLEPEDAGVELDREKYHGLPLFEPAPLMQGLPALKIPKEILEHCRDAFRRAGTEGLEERDGWMKVLREEIIRSGIEGNPSFQSRTEVQEAILRDLQMATERIHLEVHYKAGNHLCLPFTVGSQLAVDAARRLGMRSCFWGVIDGRRSNRIGDDPLHLVRIKHDFIWRLPGIGRKSLYAVYGMKALRRLKGEAVF
jgi:peptidoglycan/xylan/chitin deacetylase (PgdA/CDA1 family)